MNNRVVTTQDGDRADKSGQTKQARTRWFQPAEPLEARRLLAAAPVATLDPQFLGAPASGATAFAIELSYSDDVGINASSIDVSDIAVTGPGGAPLTVSSFAVSANTNGTPRFARYIVDAPGGTWEAADNGTYTISMQPNQVSDTEIPAQFVPEGTLATFEVDAGEALGELTKRKTTVTDSDGTSIAVKLKGGGTGQAFFRRSDDRLTIRLQDTGVKSKLFINGRGGDGRVLVDAITSNTGIQKIDAPTTDMRGGISTPGGIGALTLGSLSGSSINVFALGVVKIGGEVDESDVVVTRSIVKFKVGSLTDSNVFANVRTGTLPDDVTDFAGSNGFIYFVKVHGAYANSSIAASGTIRKLSLGEVTTANGGTPHGVASREIRKVLGKHIPDVRLLKKPEKSREVDDFVIRVLA